MPLRSPRANYYAWQNVNGVLRKVRSDGSKYYDLSNNGAEITNWWVPGGAALHVDFINSRFWWGGAVKALSDLTAIGDGSYTLAASAVGGTWTGDFTLQVELEYDLSSLPSGVCFGWRNSSSQTWVVLPTGSASSGVTRAWQGLIGAPNAITSYNMQAFGADAQSSGLTTYAGINRTVFSVPSNGYSKALWSNGRMVDGTGLNGAIAEPSGLLHFGRDPINGALPTNTTLRSVTLWKRALTAADMRKANNSAGVRPLHLLTDSFGTHGVLLMELKRLAETDGRILGWSQDAVGSKNLEDHATRFFSRPDYHDSTLVIIDGSNELDGVGAPSPGAASIAAIRSMTRRLTHARYVYVQPNPIHPTGDSRRTAWDADQAAILADLTADRYCAVLAGMQAAGDNSTEDNADIANGLWPRSTRGDPTHLNDPGAVVFGGLVYDWLEAKGWLTT